MNNYLPLRLSPKFVKQLKKIKKTDKQLYNKINDTITKIRIEPYIGERKTGDLNGVFSIDIYHAKTNYELVYTLSIDDSRQIILILLMGTQENFYDALKRYLN